MPAKKAAKKKTAPIPISATDWHTTDQDEILGMNRGHGLQVDRGHGLHI